VSYQGVSVIKNKESHLTSPVRILLIARMSCCCCVPIQTSEIAIIERFGKFHRLGEAGLLCLCFPMDFVPGTVSLRVQELTVRLESKTKDNVFVIVNVSVQYQAIREKIYNAFYVLSDVQLQMQAYVFDVVRAALCTMTLDHAFESKEKISTHLKSHLQDIMTMYGFTILNALVLDLAQ
jgi:regulator of protease activity HflC (stomatin/prohibitin superfamily)